MTLTTDDIEGVAELLEADLSPEDAERHAPHYNIAPTQMHWVAHPSLPARSGGRVRRLDRAVWGLGAGCDRCQRPASPLINARAETVAVRKRFREAFERRRCVVPADGFFEWTGEVKHRRPIWFHAPDRGILLLAGLYEEDPHGFLSFTVLTVPANPIVERVHDRMPALLARDRVGEWLARPSLELLLPAPESALISQEVSSRVNSVQHDDPACLAAPEAGTAQLGLF